MTPQEQNLVTELFDRLATLEDAQRDPEAERLIRDGLRQAPNAVYALVQTVLVQDEALKRADARLRDLEGTATRDTSFLGGMRDSLLGTRESRGSVPSVPSRDSGGVSPAWRGAPSQPMSAPMPEPTAPGRPGGSFLGTAAAAAAGVIGGSLLLDSVRSMMGHRQGGFGAVDSASAAGASGSPWGGSDSIAGSDLSRQAGLDDIGRASRPGGGQAEEGRQGLFGEGRDDNWSDDAGAADLGGGDFGGDGGGGD